MTKARKLIATAVLAAATVGLSPRAVAGQGSLALDMYCDQITGYFPVDYAVARGLVPAEFQLVQVSPGYALLYVPLQDCMSLKVNGEEIGRTPFAQFWIQVAGPEEYVEIWGATAKRDYYYAIEIQSTKNLVSKLATQLGFEGDVIESMALGEAIPNSEGGSVRSGEVVKKAAGNARYGYKWQATVLPIPTVVLPSAHTFYHTKSAGKKAEADVRCWGWIGGFGGSMQLTVDPLSEAAIFGRVLTGTSNHLTMKCDVAMSRIK